MTEPAAANTRDLYEQAEDERGKATAIYVIYLVAVFTQLPFLIGVVLAYVFRGDAAPWLRSHFSKQVGLFWWFVVWSVIGWALSPILIGFAILVPLHIWMIVRCVQGLRRVNGGQAWE